MFSYKLFLHDENNILLSYCVKKYVEDIDNRNVDVVFFEYTNKKNTKNEIKIFDNDVCIVEYKFDVITNENNEYQIINNETVLSNDKITIVECFIDDKDNLVCIAYQ
jgi:hypothetical protein